MKRIKNEQEINKITMCPTAYTKCVIGQDWYKNELEIEIVPDLWYPDYIEVDQWIMEEIDGQEFNIEDVVDKIYKKINLEFYPKFIKVTNHIKGCKTHFDVIVTK